MKSMQNLLEDAQRHREDAARARERLHRVLIAGGRRIGGADGEKAFAEAAAVVIERNRARSMSFTGELPLATHKMRARLVPDFYIAVQAEVLLGIEAELAAALEKIATLEADRAEGIALRRGPW